MLTQNDINDLLKDVEQFIRRANSNDAMLKRYKVLYDMMDLVDHCQEEPENKA